MRSLSKRTSLHIRSGISLLVFPLLVLPFWLVYREFRQQALNRDLLEAVRHDKTARAIRLLEQGADPNARDEPEDKRPFWKHLLDDLRGRHGDKESVSTALMLTLDWRGWDMAPEENLPLLQAMLDHGGNANTCGRYSFPLALAAEQGKRDTVRLLLDRGAAVNAVDAKDGTTALMRAMELGRADIARLLLDRGANVNIRDKSGGTALTWAFAVRDDTRDLLMKARRKNPLPKTSDLDEIARMLWQAGAKE